MPDNYRLNAATGSVTVEGNVIGHVESQEVRRLFSSSTAKRWFAITSEGVNLSAAVAGDETRKAAVHRLVTNAQPMRVSDVKVERSIYADCDILTAQVTFKGIALMVSRYKDEPYWVCDAQFNGSFPVFCNGTGSRVTVVKSLRDDVAAMVDAEVEKAGLSLA